MIKLGHFKPRALFRLDIKIITERSQRPTKTAVALGSSRVCVARFQYKHLQVSHDVSNQIL